MLYRAVRPFLFALDPETAHRLTLKSLDVRTRLGAAALVAAPAPRVPVRVMGLDFPNPVGLAAGLDKDGEHIDALAALGFGFIEVGAVTPRAQPGNPKPRLFRLSKAGALINRLGFNSRGADVLVENLRRSGYRGIVGVNIGKNSDTPNERALEDYIACLRKVYARATAVVAKLRRALPAGVTIIGVGGIASAADAREKLDAGASLVQLYTALVYRGPRLVSEIVRGLAATKGAR